MELRQTTCCGVRDYSGLMELDTPQEVLLDVYDRLFALGQHAGRGWRTGAFVLFTCAAAERKLPRLIRFIEENALGSCTLAPTAFNPNSNHNLQAMLWGFDHNAYDAWIAVQRRRERGEYTVGDRVRNAAEGSARYRQEAVVMNIDGDTVQVDYVSGGHGKGKKKNYTLIID